LTFISNLNTAFQFTNPDNSDVFYKFVLTRINGESRVAITQRNLQNWEDLTAFLKNMYTEKRTLDFHAMQLFGRSSERTNVFHSGSKTSRVSVRNLGRQPYKTVNMMNE